MTIKAMETGKFLRRRNGVGAPGYGVGVGKLVEERLEPLRVKNELTANKADCCLLVADGCNWRSAS
jgi:hypothetical protein